MSARFELAEFLPYRLAIISERISRRLSVDYARSHGLSVAEWRVLVHLQRHGTVSVRDIQEFTNLEKSRVSRAVQRLEAAGLVAKAPSEVDARLVEIALTAQGQTTLSAILPAAKDVESRLLEAVPAADLETFFQVIAQFHAVLDADPEAKQRSAAKDG